MLSAKIVLMLLIALSHQFCDELNNFNVPEESRIPKKYHSHLQPYLTLINRPPTLTFAELKQLCVNRDKYPKLRSLSDSTAKKLFLYLAKYFESPTIEPTTDQRYTTKEEAKHTPVHTTIEQQIADTTTDEVIVHTTTNEVIVHTTTNEVIVHTTTKEVIQSKAKVVIQSHTKEVIQSITDQAILSTTEEAMHSTLDQAIHSTSMQTPVHEDLTVISAIQETSTLEYKTVSSFNPTVTEEQLITSTTFHHQSNEDHTYHSASLDISSVLEYIPTSVPIASSIIIQSTLVPGLEETAHYTIVESDIPTSTEDFESIFDEEICFECDDDIQNSSDAIESQQHPLLDTEQSTKTLPSSVIPFTVTPSIDIKATSMPLMNDWIAGNLSLSALIPIPTFEEFKGPIFPNTMNCNDDKSCIEFTVCSNLTNKCRLQCFKDSDCLDPSLYCRISVCEPLLE